MSTNTEHKLEAANYIGEKCNSNFENYFKLHKDQHAILEGLVEHSYSGIDACFKVQYLQKGIKSMTFDSIKMRIILDANQMTDFDACINHFQDYIKQYDTAHISQQL